MSLVPRYLHDADSWNHRHDGERQGDGMAPVYALKHDDADDLGEVMDQVTATMLRGQIAAINAVHKVENTSLLELADARAKEDGYEQGIRTGIIQGLDIAKSITDAMKDTLKDRDGWDDYLVSVLDDLVVKFIDRAAAES